MLLLCGIFGKWKVDRGGSLLAVPLDSVSLRFEPKFMLDLTILVLKRLGLQITGASG